MRGTQRLRRRGVVVLLGRPLPLPPLPPAPGPVDDTLQQECRGAVAAAQVLGEGGGGDFLFLGGEPFCGEGYCCCWFARCWLAWCSFAPAVHVSAVLGLRDPMTEEVSEFFEGRAGEGVDNGVVRRYVEAIEGHFKCLFACVAILCVLVGYGRVLARVSCFVRLLCWIPWLI